VHEPVLAPASCLARGETGGDDCEGERRRAVGHLGGLTNSVCVLACPRYAFLHAYVGGKGFKVGKDDTVL
jgi:hypothetical protein